MRAGPALLLLGLSVGVPRDSSAASLSSVPSQGGRHPQALELGDASEFYDHDGRVCRKCPPGTYISVHCTNPKTEGTCLPCPEDMFVQHKNKYGMCFTCKSCRSLDEVELKPCTRTSDTQCACRNGTFCPRSLPCETCRKCTSRCPDGEAMVRPCTPESDAQCEKASTVASPAPAASPGVHGVWIVPVLLLALLAVGALVRKQKGGDRGTGSGTATCSSRTIQWLKRKFNLQRLDVQDNQQDEQAAQESQHILQIQGDASTGVPRPEQESSITERHLVPQNGRDPLEALRQSFEAFITWVPLQKWKRFMRALGLTDNEIAVAELDEKGVTEQQFQMLRTWLAKQGKAAALGTLLGTLQALGLRGVVSTVQEELVAEGLYCFEG